MLIRRLLNEPLAFMKQNYTRKRKTRLDKSAFVYARGVSVYNRVCDLIKHIVCA